MLDTFESTTTLMLIAVFLIAIIIILLSFIIPMKRQISELNRIMFTILKKDEKYDNSHDDIKRALSIINGNIGSLSSSTDQVLEELQAVSNSTKQALNELNAVSNNPVMPTPNITKMMRETIMENINIEVLLSQGMKIPNKQSTQHIIDNTLKTYPDVVPEYTIKLCLAMIENFALSASEGQQQSKQ